MYIFYTINLKVSDGLNVCLNIVLHAKEKLNNELFYPRVYKMLLIEITGLVISNSFHSILLK